MSGTRRALMIFRMIFTVLVLGSGLGACIGFALYRFASADSVASGIIGLITGLALSCRWWGRDFRQSISESRARMRNPQYLALLSKMNGAFWPAIRKHVDAEIDAAIRDGKGRRYVGNAAELRELLHLPHPYVRDLIVLNRRHGAPFSITCSFGSPDDDPAELFDILFTR